jgi:hypothetical protein
VLEGSIVIVLPVAAKVRFLDRYRLPQVSWGAVGVIVDTDERPAPNSATESWVRARFGDLSRLGRSLAVGRLVRLSRREHMYGLRVFRFRSLERDRETDERRIALIQRAVRSAVADAEAEAVGLRDCIAKTRRSAICLVEQRDSDDFHHRAKLTCIEQQLLVSEQRLVRLKDHLLFLRDIEVGAARLLTRT